MFTRNIKDTFTQGLLNAVAGVLGEAKKKCAKGCKCDACVPEEDTNEGYVSHAQRKAVWANRADDGKGHPGKKKMKEEAGVGKLGAMLKRERDAKEKKEPNGVKTEEVQELDETAKIVAHLQKRYGDNIRKSHVRSAASDFGVDVSKLAKAVRTKLGKNMLDEESDDVPFKGPYKKPGERKDEFGNKVKNVAKHLAKKAMNAQKNEEVEQIDELSTKTLEKYRNVARNDAYDADEVDDEPRFRKRAKGITQANKAIRKNFVKGVDEEVEDLDEKRGLWDNIHAKRKRIKAGSGERMRKPGSKGAPSAADLKASQTEEVSVDEAFEQIDELSKATMGRYVNKAADRMSTQGVTAGLKIAADEKSKKNFDNIAKRQKGIATAVKKLTKEEQDFIDSLNDVDIEQIDELSKDTLKKYKEKARDDFYDADDVDDGRRVRQRYTGLKMASKKLAKEEVEELDEISREAIASYTVQAADDLPNQARKTGASKVKNRIKGINMAVSRLHGEEVQLTQEEQDFVDSLNDVDIEQIDELSKDAMLKYLSANKKSGKTAQDAGDLDKMTKRMRGTDVAVRKYTAKPGSKSVRVPATEETQIDEISDATLKSYSKKALDQSKTLTGDQKVKRQVGARNAIDRLGNNTLAKEEVELDEARGRPKKAGAKDFTINPKTKEKLMHDNPEHMKKIEALQRNGVIPVQKIEANQHVMQQLQRAKLSMRGGETVNFTHGDSHHVSGEHAAKLLTKYAGMKPNEKEAFQKKIGHSHANLKSEL